jgi:hypothetical protein
MQNRIVLGEAENRRIYLFNKGRARDNRSSYYRILMLHRYAYASTGIHQLYNVIGPLLGDDGGVRCFAEIDDIAAPIFNKYL